MKLKLKKQLFIWVFPLVIWSCGSVPKNDPLSEMEADISFLASDEMRGRYTGSPEEATAAAYIAKRFEACGLKPMGDNATYFQEFEFKDEPQLSINNHLIVNGDEKELSSEFYPISMSGNGEIEGKIMDVGFGIVSNEKKYDDYSGLSDLSGNIFQINISSPDGIHPHSEYLDFHELTPRAELAIEKGAKAVIFYAVGDDLDFPNEKISSRVSPLSVPVIFSKEKIEGEISLSVEIERPMKLAKNVLGFLDNQKENTIIIGAHYDHLGMGTDGSLYRGEPAIHNGADDNASGVAGLFQLAEVLSEQSKNSNYLFIAFTGEELGLLGSNHYVKHPVMANEKINYMINFDMIGRLDSNQVAVSGVGTSPSWAVIDSLNVNGITAITSESGVGPSDHTSFYLNDIPVLHFFSGSHEDYHKPSDDEDKINYEGMLGILSFVEKVIMDADDDGKLVFVKTKDQDNENAPRFKVTLGVIPDYLYSGTGMRIDGISDDRPAKNCGLIVGDIVVKLGDYEVKDMMSYMVALSKFSKGDSSKVTVLREGETIIKDLQFD